MMSKILPFLTRHSVQHSVSGEELTFYQISTGTFMRLRSVAKPIMKAFGILFTDKKQDAGQESVNSTNKEGEEHSRVRIDAANHDVLKLRSDEREKAIEQLLEGALGNEAVGAVGELLWDALPDTLPPTSDKSQREKTIKDIPLSALVEMFQGIAKANEQLLAPFKDRAGVATAALKKVLGDESLQEPEEPSPETQTTPSG